MFAFSVSSLFDTRIFLQFFEQDSRRVMITSEDSKIHILDGVEIVHKYKGTGLF